MNPDRVAEIFGFILIAVVGLMLFAAMVGRKGPAASHLSADEAQLQALNAWLVRKIVLEANRNNPLDKMALNRVRGSAVKAFYHLKRNQAVTIQLPQLYVGDAGLSDFQISITREQLQQICFGLHSSDH